MASCPYRAISKVKARRIPDLHCKTTQSRLDRLTDEEIIQFFSHGRKNVGGEIVAIGVEQIVADL